jgi:Ca-activated chloride channel family protein
MQDQHIDPPAATVKPQRRLDPKRLGIGLFGALFAVTLGLSALPHARGLGANLGTGHAPQRAVAGQPLPKLLAPPPALPAPPPVALTRSEGSKVGFATTLDRSAVALGGDGLVRVELTMRADDIADKARVDSDIVVVLDRSGSMSGDRIEKARGAVLALIEQLSERDRLGLVIFDNSAERLIQLEAAGPAAKARWRNLVRGIELGGGTNLSDGLDQGLALLEAGRQMGRAGRVLLLSDGEANAGDVSHEGLRARGQRAARAELVLSTVGIGEGFNEYLMAQVADAGTGNFHYLASADKLGSIIERELSSTRATVASALSVGIEPGSGVEVLDAGGYPLERDGATVTFRPGSLFSGQERRVWVTLRVPSGQEQSVALGQVKLSYLEGGVARAVTPGTALAVSCVKDQNVALAAIDKTAWERAVVQEEWGRVQQDVARAVREGKREEARGWLSQYQAKQSALNASVGSAAVDSTLTESRALERQVDDAFQGADQAGKQNLFSKENLAKGRGSRRLGSVSSVGTY